MRLILLPSIPACQVDLTPLNREDRMALFINLYNANIVHALVAHGPEVASSQRSKFFQSFGTQTDSFIQQMDRALSSAIFL